MEKAANLSPSLAATKLVGEDKPNGANGKNCRLSETTSHTELDKLWHYRDEKVGP